MSPSSTQPDHPPCPAHPASMARSGRYTTVTRSLHPLLMYLADAVDMRDPCTGGHSRRVVAYADAILQALGVGGAEAALILTAARVHDIGKVAVPDAILHKPGALEAEERAVVAAHPMRGAALLRAVGDAAAALVLHHHEQWDGTGYPHRLAGSAIPLGARVIAVADSFDAMTSDRAYRAGMPVARAVAILRAGRGAQWDATPVDAFLRGLAADVPGAVSGAVLEGEIRQRWGTCP